MKLYRVTTLVRFGAGTKLTLTASQIDARRHALEAVEMHGEVGDAVFSSAVEFKVGEVIGLDHALSRAEKDSLEPVDGDAASAEADGAAARKTKAKA